MKLNDRKLPKETRDEFELFEESDEYNRGSVLL